MSGIKKKTSTYVGNAQHNMTTRSTMSQRNLRANQLRSPMNTSSGTPGANRSLYSDRLKNKQTVRQDDSVVTRDFLTQALENQFNRLSKYFDDKLNELKDHINLIEDDVAKINERVTLLENISPVVNELNLINCVCDEICERNRRILNIVLLNFIPTEGIDLLVNVNNLLGEGSNFPVASYAKFIGKTNKRGSRPIKIFFDSRDAVNLLFKNREFFSKRNLKIFNDNTVSQQKYYNQLRAELNSRLDNGESNLIIKYFNGTPKIVMQKNAM